MDYLTERQNVQDEEEWAENCTLGNTSERAEPAGDYPLFIVLLRVFFVEQEKCRTCGVK